MGKRVLMAGNEGWPKGLSARDATRTTAIPSRRKTS